MNPWELLPILGDPFWGVFQKPAVLPTSFSSSWIRCLGNFWLGSGRGRWNPRMVAPCMATEQGAPGVPQALISLEFPQLLLDLIPDQDQNPTRISPWGQLGFEGVTDPQR